MKTSRCAVMVLLMVLAGSAVSAKEETPAQPKSLYRVMKVAWREKNIFVDVRYPQFNKETIDKLLKERALSGLKGFLKDAREYQADDAANDAPDRKREYVYYADFNIHILNSSVLSVTYDISIDFGGAHPTSSKTSVAADLKTGKEITLGNLFKPDVKYLAMLSKNARSELKGKLSGGDTELLEEGTKPTAKNFGVFYFRPEQIVIVFNPYQVASYAEGEQEFVLNLWEEPYSETVRADIIQKLDSPYK